MKKILYIVSFIFVALSFTACGGGGGDSSFSGDTTTQIDINVNCVSGTPSAGDLATYITLLSGDTIVEDTDPTTVSTYHDLSGNKKICLNTGSAHILR